MTNFVSDQDTGIAVDFTQDDSDSTYHDFLKALPLSSFKVSPVGNYVTIVDRHSTLLIQESNRSGIFWNDLIEDIADEVWTLARASARSGGPTEKEFTYKNSSGQQLWLRVSALSGSKFIFFSYEDVTQRKKSLVNLVKEERLSTIGILAGGLAHQYNNLHHATMGLIFEAKKLSDSKEVRAKLDAASSMLEEGSTLSQSLLGHLRDSGDKKQTVPLAVLLERVKLLVKDELLRLNCDLQILVDTAAVECRPTALDQVLVNLIINGAHACQESLVDGIVLVSNSVDPEAQKIKIIVRDNGSGIDEKHHGKLFTPLFSTKGVYAEKGSSLSKIKGTGLGLSLARQLVEEQGGFLELESTSDSGTAFSITLPLGKMKLPRKKDLEVNQTPKNLTRHKILVIDDAPENRRLLSVYLSEFIDKLEEKENGYVDRDFLLRFEPDVIFVDWLMPSYSGHDFLQNLSKDPDLSHLIERVVIFSGLDVSSEITQWRQRVLAVIKKPMSQRKLADIMRGLS